MKILRLGADILIYLVLAAVAAAAVMLGPSLARRPDDRAAASRPARPPAPGEVRGPGVREVIDWHDRRGGAGDVSPPDVLD